MLKAALEYFILSLLAMLLGANNVAGFSLATGRLLFFTFMALMLMSLAAQIFIFQSTQWLP